jgi:hypothetical protein
MDRPWKKFPQLVATKPSLLCKSHFVGPVHATIAV